MRAGAAHGRLRLAKPGAKAVTLHGSYSIALDREHRLLRELSKMTNGVSRVHISIVTAVGAFAVSALAIWCGYLLIQSGATGAVELTIEARGVKVNLFTYIPGIAFGLFGAAIAWRALSVLIRRE